MAFLGVLTHRKTRRLASCLGISQCYAVGILEALWHVAQSQAKDGGIGRLSNRDIADEMFYDGDSDALICALVDSGWLQEMPSCRLFIHDWDHHSTDTVDNFLARNIMLYANGSMPRMRRLSLKSRADLCAQYATESHEMPQKATTLNPKPQTLNPKPISCDQEESPTAPKSSKRFVKPTAEEVHTFMVERNWKFPDGQGFIDYWDSCDWKRGKTPIKDWRATVRNLESYDWFKGKADPQEKREPILGVDYLIDEKTGKRIPVSEVQDED